MGNHDEIKDPEITDEVIAEAARDAYSFTAYSMAGWMGCVTLLREQGLDPRQVDAFLRSKHMRWAGDQDTVEEYGWHDRGTLERYLNSFEAGGKGYPLSDRELGELVDQTPEPDWAGRD